MSRKDWVVDMLRTHWWIVVAVVVVIIVLVANRG